AAPLPRGAGGEEAGGLVGVLPRGAAALLLRALEEGMGEPAGQRVALAFLDEPVLRLGGDARRLGIGHAPAEIGQPLDDRVLALVEGDDRVLALEVAEGALRFGQLALHAGDLGLEEVARLPGELEL